MSTSRLILFYGLVYSQTTLGLNSGNACIIEETSGQGTCKNLKNCPKIIYGVLNQKEPTMCEFEGDQRIVCCPDPIQEITTEGYISESSLSQKKCQGSQCDHKSDHKSDRKSDPKSDNKSNHKSDHKSDQLILKDQANPKEFPHMALIGFESDGHILWRCVGTLISDEYVLTAAHCLESHERTRKYIRLGELNIESDLDDAKPETFNITRIIQHPDYESSLIYNDIALLRLDRKVKFSQYIRPACLPTTSDSSNIEATLSGWGTTQWGYHSSHMLKSRISILTHTECNSLFSFFYAFYNGTGIKPNGIRPGTQICGEPKTVDRDLCKESSGAPLSIYDHSSLSCLRTVIGLSSFGAGCGRSIPTVYTKVFPYVGWIKTII